MFSLLCSDDPESGGFVAIRIATDSVSVLRGLWDSVVLKEAFQANLGSFPDLAGDHPGQDLDFLELWGGGAAS